MTGSKAKAHHRKHAGTSKHHAKAKHTPTAHKRAAAGHRQVARRITTPMVAAKPRGLSLGDVACCAADALAASLRLAGGSVAPADILALYGHTADCSDAGASIVATLEAAYAHGLGGVRPVSYEPVSLDAIYESYERLILGVEMPGSHALVATGDGPWITWGEELNPAEFPDAVIEEAWQVTW